MKSKSSVFERTYQDYIKQISGMDLESIGRRLGCNANSNEIFIPMFGMLYNISKSGIADVNGNQPDFFISVILCKYVLLCPVDYVNDYVFVAYRDFKDSAPLINYFTNNTEGAISEYFSGRLDELQSAAKRLGGYVPNIKADCDFIMKVDVLPTISIIILFNDFDDDFPAKCSILFERRAEKYLDAECLAGMGSLLVVFLKEASLR